MTTTRQEDTMTDQQIGDILTSRATDPIAALIQAHTPDLRATRRALPTPDADAVARWEARREAQARHDAEGTPRHLIPVAGIRCGEYL